MFSIIDTAACVLPFLRRTPKHPLMATNHAAFQKVDHDRRLDECVFTVLDAEMTGLDPCRDEIVSLGAVRLDGLSIVPDKTFARLVKPDGDVSKTSTLIHRITPSQAARAEPLDKVLPEFVEFLNGTLIVGHNVGLDMSFLNRACRRLFGAELANPCLDTMRMAKIHREEMWENYYDRFDLNVSYNLSDLAKEHSLPRFPAHDALADAMQTAYLFIFLVRKLKDGGIVTLRDLFDAGRSWRWYF